MVLFLKSISYSFFIFFISIGIFEISLFDILKLRNVLTPNMLWGIDVNLLPSRYKEANFKLSKRLSGRSTKLLLVINKRFNATVLLAHCSSPRAIPRVRPWQWVLTLPEISNREYIRTYKGNKQGISYMFSPKP